MATAKKAVKRTAKKATAKKAVSVKSTGKYLAFAIGERVRVPYRVYGETEAQAIENLLGKTPIGGYCLPHGFTVKDPEGNVTHFDF